MDGLEDSLFIPLLLAPASLVRRYDCLRARQQRVRHFWNDRQTFDDIVRRGRYPRLAAVTLSIDAAVDAMSARLRGELACLLERDAAEFLSLAPS